MTTHDLRRELRQLGYPTRRHADGLYSVKGLWPRRHTEFALWRLWEGLSRCK